MKTALFSVRLLLCALPVITPAALRAQGTPNSAVVRSAANDVSTQAATKTQPPPPVVNGPPREYVLLTGSSSLIEWEKYKAVPHDQFWGSFVRATRTRFQQLQKLNGNDSGALYTWLVFEDGYRARGEQDHQDYIADINSVRDKYHLNLVPVKNGNDVINYLNGGQDRSRLKVVDFEYFGHSNRCCWMFDYSNNIDSASKNFFHEDQFPGLKRGDFDRKAFIKSWGCHTGEEMSAKFHEATGLKMIGAVGRTDFSYRDEATNGIIPTLSSPDGKWVW